jgi:hypothetical protein
MRRSLTTPEERLRSGGRRGKQTVVAEIHQQLVELGQFACMVQRITGEVPT